jgi:CheY-like chemotaxis protein
MSSLRILVVDDEAPTRNFLCDGLGALGITDQAIGVASAEDALEQARNEPPDLVISDIRMTGLNGLDLARYLRQSCPDTKVILVTGYSTRDIEKTASALGVDALIRKPFGLEALGEAVRKALSQARSARPDESGLAPAAIDAVARRLDMLKRDVGAQWMALIDAEHHIHLQSGSADNLDGALAQVFKQGWIAAIMAASGHSGPSFVYLEGQPHDIYLTSVDQQYCLAFVYDRRWQANRVGAVWLTVKQSVPELSRQLSNANGSRLPNGQAAVTTPPNYHTPGQVA